MKFLRPFPRIGFVVLALMFSITLRAADGFSLKDGDRVVFYGDSITDQRLYTTFVETYVVTRFPAWTIDFTHSGWGGDRVGGGHGGKIQLRLQRDVFPYKPTVMTIMLGMNDGGYRAFDQTLFDTYRNGLQSIIDAVRASRPDARLTLIRPSPYDDVTRPPKFTGGYNAVLVRYGEAVKAMAASGGLTVADLNAPVVAMLEKAKASDAALSEKIIPDRVHPGPAGHLIMATALLKAWNAPALVSDVRIDAAARRVAKATNTRIDDLSVTPKEITWNALDGSLPMPVAMTDPVVALAVASSDFVASLDQQPLQVTGLTGPAYELFIGGALVGTFSSSELTEGVNLALLPTPMAAQAAEVHKLTLQRANLHQTRWRAFQVPYAQLDDAASKAALTEILSALDEADRAAARLQRAMAQPVLQRFRLRAVTAAELAASGKAIGAIPAEFGTNLALNKSWVASDPNTHGWNAGLTDGSWENRSKTTFATNDGPVFPKMVTVDLGAENKIGRIVTGVPRFGSTKTVDVSVSADGQTFDRVGRYVFSLNREETRLFEFDPVQVRYVRLTYIDHYDDRVGGYSQNFAFTTDLQVFAP